MNSKKYLESIEDFQISFGGKKSIDAEVFTKSINEIISLVKASANAIDPNCSIKLKIKANKEGSFKSIIDVVVSYLPDLLPGSNVASNVIISVLNYFLIKKHLKGEKPKNIETKNKKMIIQNQKDEILQVPAQTGDTFFKNNKIENPIINIITNNYYDRDYLSLKTKDKEVRIDKSEYENMAKKIIDDDLVEKTIIHKPINVDLPLKKPDLLGNSKWKLKYNDKIIEAKIEDKLFLKRVQGGEIKNLYAGVKIPCVLQVEYGVDKNDDIVPNSEKYTILEITGDIIEPKPVPQGSFL